MGFKVNSNNEIKSGNFAKVETKAEFLGGDDVTVQTGEVTAIANNRITLDSTGDISYGYTDDVVIYKYNADDSEYNVDGNTSDIEASTADTDGSTVAMFDIEGEDGVYDVIVIL